MTQIWTRPLEACLRWQAEMLKAAEPMAMAWFERQLEATHMTLDTVERLSHCSDLGEAANIQREWFDGTVKRLTAELAKFTEQATSLSREAVSATREVMHPAAETAPKVSTGHKEAQVDAAA
ncbi:MAG TPA: phasin family protein [Stellaceae bacterium]|nr:phasin family protein [Stellaceae bacterium]